VDTPGVIEIRSWKLLPLSGMFSTNFLSITVPTEASRVLRAVPLASTVTDSEAAPTGKVKFKATAL
jgi:hypothetical protein